MAQPEPTQADILLARDFLLRYWPAHLARHGIGAPLARLVAQARAEGLREGVRIAALPQHIYLNRDRMKKDGSYGLGD